MTETDEPYLAVVASVRRCLAEAASADFASAKTRRMFDPAWAEMRGCVVTFAKQRREAGANIETVIAEVKAAALDAVPELAPHHAVRSAIVGWAVAAFHERDR